MRRIYALVRTSGDVDPQYRLEQHWLATLPKEAARNLIEARKVIALGGDIASSQTLCGLSPENLQKVIKETQVVINSAADISLVKKAPALARTNVFGALRMAHLAEQCPLLQRYVGTVLFDDACLQQERANKTANKASVSTLYAYMQPNIHKVEEQVIVSNEQQIWAEYDALMEGNCLINLDWHEGGYPWGYGYTKHLAEQ